MYVYAFLILQQTSSLGRCMNSCRQYEKRRLRIANKCLLPTFKCMLDHMKRSIICDISKQGSHCTEYVAIICQCQYYYAECI